MPDDVRVDRENLVERAARLFALKHVDAWAALAFARMPTPAQAFFQLYARQEWDKWPTVESALLQVMPTVWYARQAARDAGARVLWRCADVSQDGRARALGVRASDYRRCSRAAEFALRQWLLLGSIAYLHALSDGFTPGPRHSERVEPARTPNRPRAVLRNGRQLVSDQARASAQVSKAA